MENLSEKEMSDIDFHAINPNVGGGEKKHSQKLLEAELLETIVQDIKNILDEYVNQQEGLDSPEMIIGKALDYIKRLKRP